MTRVVGTVIVSTPEDVVSCVIVLSLRSEVSFLSLSSVDGSDLITYTGRGVSVMSNIAAQSADACERC